MKVQRKRSHFNGREWFRKKVEQRTDAALQTKNREFAMEHASDSGKQLIDYLTECAKDLQHTPGKNEVIGGKYIANHFDGWNNALLAAGLPLPTKGVDRRKTRLYQDEYNLQRQLFMQELQDRKDQKVEDQQKQTEQQKDEKSELLAKENSWVEAHINDTDEELLDYVRQCAKQLGHTPYRSEVVGSNYIKERFGGWYEVLSLAKLPIPKDMKKPSPKKQRMIKKL